MTELKSLSALIVEPHAGMRNSLHNMLSLFGMSKIDDVVNSTQAIRALNTRPYDLILCEYELDGGQDGQQLLEDLRHHRLMQPSAMFFMVTGEGQFSKVIGVAELQPNDYILKPFTAESMRERIERALEKRDALLPVHELMELGDHRAAIDFCQEQEAGRFAADFMRLRAENYLMLGEPSRAAPIYAELWDSKAIHWARLGQAKTLFMQGHTEDARGMLEDLLSHNRRFLDAYDWLARTHEAEGRLEQAKAVLSDAVALSPHAIRRLRRLGEVALESGDIDTAEKALRQVVNRARFSEFRDPEDHARLVQTLVRKGDPLQAASVIRDLDKALLSAPNREVCSAIASAMLHDYTGDKERLEQSVAAAITGVRTAPAVSNELKMALALAALSAGKEEVAEEVVREVMRNVSGSQGLARAVDTLDEAGHGEMAQRLAAESRMDVARMVAAGAERAKAGDFQGAVEIMLEAVARLPDNPQVVFNASVAVLKCLEHNGWEDHLGVAALEMIANVRRLDPVNPKLNALSGLYEELLRKYNIRPGRRTAPLRRRRI
ncbi:response regulator [Massilia endophytica]|uniref:response regulator n=1 Tax=Massilia endophytica TaxID=2899220 RepID=UPI001E644A46|nr:response regulator [Massilia endophytica]UGQ46086.1 response regulator [Massilia endophytica]